MSAHKATRPAEHAVYFFIEKKDMEILSKIRI